MRFMVLLAGLLTTAVQAAGAPTIDVYRDSGCSCCKVWISHLQKNGFAVNDHVETDMAAVKRRLGVPARLSSCHTALIEGKFVEGHVPAADILKLRQRQDLLGLTVPGMPIGAPGMEMGERRDRFQVLSVDRYGIVQVENTYPER